MNTEAAPVRPALKRASANDNDECHGAVPHTAASFSRPISDTDLRALARGLAFALKRLAAGC